VSLRNVVLIGTIVWLTTITALPVVLNIGIPRAGSRPSRSGAAPFRVGFLPVTCHLTCPVTHFINQSISGDGMFDPVRFSG
jgi:NitT/TauT family transport system substrate-binding protein